jgi:structural maintenance of chromosome 3 (chondroitin sulfate proteoglycan 6)
MSIKRISIRNLFSYKAIDIDISPGLNVVVGKNGSGKSNFVNSLLFVLTDKFSTRDRKMIENVL